MVKVRSKSSSAPKVGSVTHALAILELLADSPTPLGVTTISKTIGQSPSSCFNILKTLMVSRYVVFDPVRKVYTLGYAPMRLARRSLDPSSAFQLLRPSLEEVAQKFAVTTALWRSIQEEHVVLLGFCEHEGGIRIHMTVGQQFPIFAGAFGRCVAANQNLSRAKLKTRFDALRWQKAPVFDDYAHSIVEAKERGWAVDMDSTFAGVTNICAPIIDAKSKVAYGISATMFTAQQSAGMVERLARELLSTAKDAAQIIGLR